MTNWHLSEHVAAVQQGVDLVFLDLELDRYSCLPGQPGLHLEGRLLSTRTLDAIQPLLANGLLGVRRGEGECAERLPPARASRDLGTLPAVPIGCADLRDFLAAWLEALTRFPGRSLLSLHKQVRSPTGRSIGLDLDRVKRRTAVFQTLVPWVPFPGACLFRSYLLLRFLQRGGGDAKWVVGVRTWPFEAHCWLQLDDVALDERCERLVRFQPLLAI